MKRTVRLLKPHVSPGLKEEPSTSIISPSHETAQILRAASSWPTAEVKASVCLRSIDIIATNEPIEMISKLFVLLLLLVNLNSAEVTSEVNATLLCSGFIHYMRGYLSGSMLSKAENEALLQNTGFDSKHLDWKENTSNSLLPFNSELLRKGSACHNNRQNTKKGRKYILECMIVKDQAHYISEHLAYHFVQGVDHFVIYDGNSTDNLSSVLKPWIESGTVTLVPQIINERNKQHFQGYFYRRCFEHYAKAQQYTWVTFLDVDEFVTPLQGRCLSDLMDDYTDYGGLSIPWLVFRNVNRTTIANPHEFRIETTGYTKGLTAPFVKPFCQTDKTRWTHKYNPHFCEFLHGAYPVDENFTKLTHHAKPNSLDPPVKVEIAHYQYLSIQESLLKVKRDATAKWHWQSENMEDLNKICIERLNSHDPYSHNHDPMTNAEYIRQYVVNPAKALLGIGITTTG